MFQTGLEECTQEWLLKYIQGSVHEHLSNITHLEPAETNVFGNSIELPFKVGTVYFEVQKIREEPIRVLVRGDVLG